MQSPVFTSRRLAFREDKWRRYQNRFLVEALNRNERNPDMRTYTIEIRVDFETATKESQEEQMLIAARMAAKHLLTTAMLLSSGGRKPLISLQSGDLMEGDKEINLADDFDTVI